MARGIHCRHSNWFVLTLCFIISLGATITPSSSVEDKLSDESEENSEGAWIDSVDHVTTARCVGSLTARCRSAST